MSIHQSESKTSPSILVSHFFSKKHLLEVYENLDTLTKTTHYSYFGEYDGETTEKFLVRSGYTNLLVFVS